MKLNLILPILLVLLAVRSCRQPVQKKPTVDFTEDYIKATSFLNSNPDSAYYLLNKIAAGSKDSAMLGIVNTLMGRIQVKAGDIYGGQEALLKGLSFFNLTDKKNFYSIALCYNELGNSSLDLKNYDFAIDYYNKAIEKATDSFSRSFALNGKAVAFQRKKEFAGAISILNYSLANSTKDKREYARVLSNLARTKWLQDPKYPALAELMEAKNIRESEKDLSGLHTSYAHLSDYYASKNADSATKYARKMYEVAMKLENPNDELESLQKLIALSPAANVKSYFTRFNGLNDSLQTARNAAKNQFAIIRYDAEKSKLENLNLQRENTEKKLQIIKQRILFYTTLAIAAIVTLFGISWIRKRKEKMDWEKQQALKEQKLKTSQKVHDVVANGLYRLMSGLEHEKNIDREDLIGRVNDLYEKSRDISYEELSATSNKYEDNIEALLSSFSNETTRVVLVGNSATVWEGISEAARKEVEFVLQELMVNMKKHSQAQNVVVKFDQREGSFHIQYVDDGIGLPPNFNFGNGLASTENRILGLGGHIIFDTAKTKGTKINISFPIGI